MNKYLFIFAFAIVFFASLFSFKLVFNAGSSVQTPQTLEPITPQQFSLNTNKNFTKLKDTNQTSSFVVDEYELSWDLVDPIFAKVTMYELNYKNLDKFELSCVTQVLDEEKIIRKTTKNGNNYDVFVSLKDKIKAQKVFNLLQDYFINGTYNQTFKIKENLYDET